MSEETATTTEPTTTASKDNKDKNKSRKIKRKRHEGTTASLHQQWKEDRYDRLVHQAQKQLHKQAKQVKTMFIQKKIRQLKKTDDNNNNSNNSNNDTPTPEIPYKQVDLDIVVQQATRQLGLYHANPRYSSETANTIPAPTTDPLVQNILQHAKFQQAMEEWNEKVVDYRRFCMQLDEPHSVPPKAKSSLSKQKSKKGSTTNSGGGASSNLQDTPTTSLFGTLNGDSNNISAALDPSSMTMMMDPSMSAYGPAATMEENGMPKKKNRQGQRGRKAKALAIQAKKEGRKQYHVSLNWREKKEDKKDENGSGEQRPHKRAKKSHDGKDGTAPAASQSTSNKNSSNNNKNNDTSAADAAEAHPSWAAKQQQKTGIVAFQGTKITF